MANRDELLKVATAISAARHKATPLGETGSVSLDGPGNADSVRWARMLIAEVDKVAGGCPDGRPRAKRAWKVRRQELLEVATAYAGSPSHSEIKKGQSVYTISPDASVIAASRLIAEINGQA